MLLLLLLGLLRLVDGHGIGPLGVVSTLVGLAQLGGINLQRLLLLLALPLLKRDSLLLRSLGGNLGGSLSSGGLLLHILK